MDPKAYWKSKYTFLSCRNSIFTTKIIKIYGELLLLVRAPAAHRYLRLYFSAPVLVLSEWSILLKIWRKCTTLSPVLLNWWTGTKYAPRRGSEHGLYEVLEEEVNMDHMKSSGRKRTRTVSSLRRGRKHWTY